MKLEHRQSPRGCRAFTLLEILVVVAIIALLISIMLPSLAKARAQARAALCMNHLKQLLTANYYYSQDSKGLLPHYDRWLWSGDSNKPEAPQSGTLFGRRGSDPAVRPTRNYAVNAEIYKCPSDEGQRRSIGSSIHPILPPTFSYTRNVYIMDVLRDTQLWGGETGPNGSRTWDYMPIERPKRPSDTLMFFEEYEFSPMNDGYILNNQYDFLTMRHEGRAMAPYHDLHVAPVMSKWFNKAAIGSDLRHYFLAPGLPRP